jgi:pimeloyl-ACP methyl ester carboxylesterase
VTRFVDIPGDGRISYAVYGARDGAAVVLLHGFSDSRYTGAVFDAAARRAGVQLIVPDRPGIGYSTGRFGALAACGPWLAHFVGALGFERVPLTAVSGGGPFALASARFAADRVERVLVVSGLGPPALGTTGMPAGQRAGIAMARVAPGLAGVVLAAVALFAKLSPERFLGLVGAHSSPVDAGALRREASIDTVVRPFVEAYRQGPRGVANELRLLLRPWRFALEEIRVPVRFEHGSEDLTVPVAAARALCRSIPDAVLRVREGVGHFTLAPRYAEELLAYAAFGAGG